MIKLPADEVDRLIGTGLGAPLSKPGQRPMREWVLLPFDGAAARRVDRAYAFVSGRAELSPAGEPDGRTDRAHRPR